MSQQLLDYVLCVHIDHDQSSQSCLLLLVQFGSHQVHQADQLSLQLFKVFLNTSLGFFLLTLLNWLSLVLEGLLDLVSPADLRGCQHHLARMFQHPVSAESVRIGLESLQDYIPYRHVHLVLELVHPFFDVAFVGVDGLDETDALSLLGENGSDFFVLGEVDAMNIFENLFEVRLDCEWILGLREYLEQLQVREEVEPCELLLFLLEVVVQLLLDQLDALVRVLRTLQQSFLRHVLQHARVRSHLVHRQLPVGVHIPKALALLRQLFGDVLTVEDGLQIHPLLLKLDPLIDDLGHEPKSGIPENELLFEGLFEGRVLESLSVDYVFVQLIDDGFVRTNDVVESVLAFAILYRFVGNYFKSYFLPLGLHPFQTHLDAVLFPCSLPDLHYLLDVVHHSHLQRLPKRKVGVGVERLANSSTDFFEVVGLDSLVLKCPQDGHLRLKFLHLLLYVQGYFLHAGDFLFAEHSDAAVQRTDPLLHKPLRVLHVQTRPAPVHPVLELFLPLVDDSPQIVVGLEILGHLMYFGVLRLLYAEHGLIEGILFALLEVGLETGADDLGGLVGLLVVLHLVEALVEARDRHLSAQEIALERLLVLFHLLQELHLQLLHRLRPRLHQRRDLLRRTEHHPTLVELVVGVAVVELLDDFVVLERLIDVELDFGELGVHELEVAVEVYQLFDRLWVRVNLVLYCLIFAEGVHYLVPDPSCDKLNQVVDQVLVYLSQLHQDVRTVDFEHPHVDSLGDQSTQFMDLLLETDDLLANTLDVPGRVLQLDLKDVLLRVYFKFVLESIETPQVKGEWLDCRLDLNSQLFVEQPQPKVFVGQLEWPFVGVRVLWLLFWLLRTLDVSLHLLRLVKVSQNLRFDIINFTELLQGPFEEVEDNRHE